MSDMVAVKVESYKVTKRGQRGVVCGLPPLWVADLGIQIGDRIDVYRTLDDQLVLRKAPKQSETRPS